MLLFFILLTRIFKDPLHALIQGKSGSGKPIFKENNIAHTQSTYRNRYCTDENTLYHSGKDYWKHKILLIEDLDGAYNALLPLKGIMSNTQYSQTCYQRSQERRTQPKWLYAEGPVCVAGATTKDKIFEDNANRSF